MTSGSLSQLGELISVAQAAGEIISKYFRKGLVSQSMKTGRANVVTKADLEAQRAMIDRLSRLFPHVPVLGKRTNPQAFQTQRCVFSWIPWTGR